LSILKAHIRGFTLLEMLVSLVLLSTGMLGAWALLIASLKNHADARCFAAATNLARDMADRIRANPLGGARYVTDGNRLSEIGCAAPNTCDVTQLAAADVAWFTRAADVLLPGAAKASIEYEPATGIAAIDRYAITLRWRGTRADDFVTLQVLAPPVAG
jgi:type IV pilus assembly protein PilV